MNALVASASLAGTFVVDPAQAFHYRWLIVISLAVCYNIIFIIGRGVFWGLHNLNPAVWYALDYLCDLVYLLDMLANSRTGYLEQGILVRNTRKLTQHYLSSIAFKLDVASLIPTDLAYTFMAGPHCLTNRVPCPIIVRLNRLLKFHRLTQFFDRTESATNFPFVFRISKLVFYILVIIHWNACLYFTISYVIGFGSDHWVYQPLKPYESNLAPGAGALAIFSASQPGLAGPSSANYRHLASLESNQALFKGPQADIDLTSGAAGLAATTSSRVAQPYERQLAQFYGASAGLGSVQQRLQLAQMKSQQRQQNRLPISQMNNEHLGREEMQ